MQKSILTSALLAASVHAYVYTETLGAGNAFYAAPVLFEEAARTPNNTNSITFSIDNVDGWHWRVNITNIAVPNATVAFPRESVPITPDPHIAYTTYDLQWPGRGTLNDQLASMANASSSNSDDLSMCAYVTSGLATSSTQTDCSSALGDQCVQSMMTDLANNVNDGQCSWGPTTALQGCENSFTNTPDGLSTLGYRIGNSTTTPNVTAKTLQQSETFFYTNSYAAAVTNLTYLEEQQEALQILILQVGAQSQVLCMSFNDAVANKSSSASASGTSSGPGSTSSSSAVGAADRMVGLGVLGLAGLAAGFSLL